MIATDSDGRASLLIWPPPTATDRITASPRCVPEHTRRTKTVRRDLTFDRSIISYKRTNNNKCVDRSNGNMLASTVAERPPWNSLI